MKRNTDLFIVTVPGPGGQKQRPGEGYLAKVLGDQFHPSLLEANKKLNWPTRRLGGKVLVGPFSGAEELRAWGLKILHYERGRQAYLVEASVYNQGVRQCQTWGELLSYFKRCAPVLSPQGGEDLEASPLWKRIFH